jgi:hypothetical protein
LIIGNGDKMVIVLILQRIAMKRCRWINPPPYELNRQ